MGIPMGNWTFENRNFRSQRECTQSISIKYENSGGIYMNIPSVVYQLDFKWDMTKTWGITV
jgi:hypothetical protein